MVNIRISPPPAFFGWVTFESPECVEKALASAPIMLFDDDKGFCGFLKVMRVAPKSRTNSSRKKEFASADLTQTTIECAQEKPTLPSPEDPRSIDRVAAAEGQQGKLVVVDTASNGFPLVQELVQQGAYTIFLPWQVPSIYKLEILWANGETQS